MKQRNVLLLIAFFIAIATWTATANRNNPPSPFEEITSIQQDTIPFKDRFGDFINDPNFNPFDLDDPSSVRKEVEYDPETNLYVITEKIGDEYYRAPTYMTFEEYLEYKEKEDQKSYFQKLAGVSDKNGENTGIFEIGNPFGNVNIQQTLTDRLFGGTEVNIKPQGSIDLRFGYLYNYTEDPTRAERARRNFNPIDFQMQPNVSVGGGIGEKLNLDLNYNANATFDFDNQMKLAYSGEDFDEDGIIKSIEAGNVTMPLNGSLIQGVQNLFGIKTQLQFGRLYLTMIAAQQNSERETIEIQGGSEVREFEVYADDYEENRHFLLSQYFRETFDTSLTNLPQILSLAKIVKVEVWATNTRGAIPTANENGEVGPREIVALADLGEGNRLTSPDVVRVNPTADRALMGTPGAGFVLPQNAANNLNELVAVNENTGQPIVDVDINNATEILQTRYELSQPKDFEKINAQLLREGADYSVNRDLGFINIRTNLRQDQVVAVAFSYTYRGQTYQVGQFLEQNKQNDKILFLKMLRGTTPNVQQPVWDLMMKNFYNIQAYQVDQQDFRLDIFYEDPGRGIKRFLPFTELQGIPLIQVFNLDELNNYGDPGANGVFDFVPELTIYPQTGSIMIPVLEPFGDHLAKQISPNLRDSIVYSQLYDSTAFVAREFAELNRFSIRGQYRPSGNGSGQDISLGTFNLQQGNGAVIVKAGGRILKENIDYQVNYAIGRVTIINEEILRSGQNIEISYEDSSLFGFQTKTLLGVRADYRFSENFNLGGTYMQLFERPFTQKVNVGDDPINNKIYGLDVSYSGDAPWLTRLVDKIPLIDTKAPSNISIYAEGAAMQPGHARAINENDGDDKGGVMYIDDFEGSTNRITLRQPGQWFLASTPQNDDQNNNPLFPESSLINNLRYGANRALLNWYWIDPILRTNSGANDVDPYTTQVNQSVIFPNRQLGADQLQTVQSLNLYYDPTQRGPYNFDVPNGGYPGYTAGINNNGDLNDPASRWGGIMRGFITTNFEQSNVEFVEFWLMSPYLGEDANNGMNGDLYIELGNVSEDILRDSRRFFENGLPTPTNPDRQVDKTIWSNVPEGIQIANNLAPETGDRTAQDVGYDGANNDEEAQKFGQWLQTITSSGLPNDVKQAIQQDPANDDFTHYYDYPDGTPIALRYRKFNNPQNNSQETAGNNIDDLRAATRFPEDEDINRDNTMSETEAYFQYRIPIQRDSRREGRAMIKNRYITDEQVVSVNGNEQIWYRFRVPINDPAGRKSIGGIQDFRSIRFMRMYLTGFEEPVNMRFATLDLVRNQWRTYRRSLSDNVLADPDAAATTIDVNAVNIEENSSRCPFNYLLPLGIRREQNVGVFNFLQNEQSLSLEVTNLSDGDARGVFKIANLDIRNYERLKMFVHAEQISYPFECNDDAVPGCRNDLEDDDLTIFMRIGTDFVNNYYEYEIPLKLSDPNALPDVPQGEIDPAYSEEVWKNENEFDFPLQWLIEAKKERNRTDSLNFEYLYTNAEMPEGHRIKIKGNPSIGLVKMMMIGVRNPDINDPNNPKRDNSGGIADDGLTHCVEIWANELRLSGLNEDGGVAGIARLDAQLADFGNFSASAEYSSIGYGGVDQQLNERALEDLSQVDVSASIGVDQFFPDSWSLNLPLYAAYSQTSSSPKFDPYQLDITLEDQIAEQETAEDKERVREQARKVSTLTTVSMTNVSKGRTASGAPLPWDISNFTAGYAYTESEYRDPLIEYDRVKEHQATLDYTYTIPTKPIEPFKGLEKDWLRPLKDFNFNPLPSSFTFGSRIIREDGETRYRFTENPDLETYFNKQFTWDRTYGLNWDFAKSLKINFNATNLSVIDEPLEGELFRQGMDAKSVREIVRDSIWTNLQDLGRTQNYNHTVNVNFTLPTKSFRFLDWVTVRAQYSADYAWSAAPLNAIGIGNVIQNGQNGQINADLNFERLYDKSDYLKAISRQNASNANNRRRRPAPTRNSGKKEEDKKKEKKIREPSKAEKALIRPFLLLRKARLSYSEQSSTVIPGFTPMAQAFGLSEGFDAPGWDFAFGMQPRIRTLAERDLYTNKDWLFQASQSGWITRDPFFVQNVAQDYTQTLQGSISIEPFPNFKLDLEINRQFSESHLRSFLFHERETDTYGTDDNRRNSFVHTSPNDVGTMSISHLGFNNVFRGGTKELFDEFDSNRLIISNRLGVSRHTDSLDRERGYTFGYGSNNFNVMVPALFALHSGQDANSMELHYNNYAENILFKQLPLPNWRFTYDGLSRLPFFKDIFKQFAVTHGYRSVVRVSSFETNPGFIQGQRFSDGGNYISKLSIPAIIIEEAFDPLVAIDFQLQNDLRFGLNFARSRSLALQQSNLVITNTSAYTASFGWIVPEVNVGFLQRMVKKAGGTTDKIKDRVGGNRRNNPGGPSGGASNIGDLNLTTDFTYQEEVSTLFNLGGRTDGDFTTSRDVRSMRISVLADYQVISQLNVGLYFNYNMNNPRATGFRVVNSDGGLSIRFTLD